MKGSNISWSLPLLLFSFIIFIMANDLYIEIHVTSEEEVCGIVSVQQFECPIAEVILIVSHRRGDTGLLWSSVAWAGGWASKWVEPGGGRHLADDAWPSNLCCEKELAHIQSGWERHVCNQVRRDGATIAVTNSRRSGRICEAKEAFLLKKEGSISWRETVLIKISTLHEIFHSKFLYFWTKFCSCGN